MSLKWKDRSASIQLNKHLSSPSSGPRSEPASRDTKGTNSGAPWKVCSLVESCIPTKILDMGLEYTPREIGQSLVFSCYGSLKQWGLARSVERGPGPSAGYMHLQTQSLGSGGQQLAELDL